MTEDIKDLVEFSKAPTVNIPQVIEMAYRRGVSAGVKLAEQKAIEAIQQEK